MTSRRLEWREHVPRLWERLCRLLCLLSDSCCLTYSSTLKMEATCSSKTWVHFRRATQCYIPEDRNLEQICRIWGSHSGDYEEFYLLGYNAVSSVGSQPTFRMNMSPLSSGSKISQARNQRESKALQYTGIKFSLCIINHAPRYEDVWGSRGICSPFLYSALNGVVSFTFLPLYPRGKSIRYPLDRRLGGRQSRSSRCGDEKNLFSCRESNPNSSDVHRAARRYTDWAIPASRTWRYAGIIVTAAFILISPSSRPSSWKAFFGALWYIYGS
jgi:hypothetical protein